MFWKTAGSKSGENSQTCITSCLQKENQAICLTVLPSLLHPLLFFWVRSAKCCTALNSSEARNTFPEITYLNRSSKITIQLPDTEEARNQINLTWTLKRCTIRFGIMRMNRREMQFLERQKIDSIAARRKSNLDCARKPFRFCFTALLNATCRSFIRSILLSTATKSSIRALPLIDT